jgi:FkbM family methyltransferase
MGQDLLKSIENDMVIYDIGAFVGEYTIPLGLINGVEVVAFEPSEDAFSELEHNAEKFDLEETRLLNCGISDGATPTYTRDVENRKLFKNKVIYKPVGNESVEIDIDSMSGSDILNSDLNLPDIIKIDVAGGEADVIRALIPLLKSSHVMSIYIEIHLSMWKYKDQNLCKIFEVLAGLDYEMKPLGLRGGDLFLKFTLD